MQAKLDISELDQIRNSIMASLHELEFDQLKDQITDYNDAIRKTLAILPESPLTENELQTIQRLIVEHQQLIRGFEYKRKNVLAELKKLKRGQTMKQTYPQD